MYSKIDVKSKIKDYSVNFASLNEIYKLIDEDEVLVLYDGANAGEVMLSKQGFLSSTMAVVTPKTDFFEKRFLFYFLKISELKKLPNLKKLMIHINYLMENIHHQSNVIIM
jgi:restriction endonuclease S subunit